MTCPLPSIHNCIVWIVFGEIKICKNIFPTPIQTLKLIVLTLIDEAKVESFENSSTMVSLKKKILQRSCQMSKNIFQKFSDALSDKKKQVIVAIPKNISYTIIFGTSKRSVYAVKNGTKVGRLFDNICRSSMQ